LLLVAPQDRADDLASYHESWLPTTTLPVILWIVLIGITFNARRVSRTMSEDRQAVRGRAVTPQP
jgi:hypothetical protein